MGFDFPEAFLFLLILPPLVWVLWRGESRARQIVTIFKGRPLGKWHANSRLVLIAIFIGSLVTVGAKPYVESRNTGTFLFLIDVSRSMEARYSCSEPTFLDRAKNVMREIITEVPEAKFGIVAFDRLAFPITQITYDRSYLEQAIEYGLHIGLTYDATATNVTNALSVIAGKKQRLAELYNDVSYVILLSDGHIEGNYQNSLRLPFIELAKTGIRIISVGIGNPGETPVPIVTDTGQCRKELYTDLQGNRIFVPLRDDVLAYIAAGTQGNYFGESQITEIVRYLRDNGLENIGADIENIEPYRRDISWIFLVFVTVTLLGVLILKTNRLN